MKLSSTSSAALHDALIKISDLYTSEEDQLVSTDFYFMPDRESGNLLVFNDNDEEIALVTIPEWTEYDTESFYEMVAADLTEAIKGVNGEGEMERLAVWMPYSFVLVDTERESVAELLLVDNDTLLVTESLLQGLDEELNNFIKDLLDE